MSWFNCVLCGRLSISGSPEREAMRCSRCGATWRARAMALGVLQSLGFSNVSLNEVIENWSIRGLGVSDDIKLSHRLGSRFDYVNTHFHKGPKLDLTDVDAQWLACARFVTCSDVLEHIPPPAREALHGLYSIVEVGGSAIISVPYISANESIEFYPNLERYEVDGDRVVWFDASGQRHVDLKPEFHGGTGQTLAFRVWSLTHLEIELITVGFSKIERLTFDKSCGVPPLKSGDVVLLARK